MEKDGLKEWVKHRKCSHGQVISLNRLTVWILCPQKAKIFSWQFCRNQCHTYSCSTLPCFHLLPPSLGMFAQGKEVQRAKKRRQCIDLARVGFAEVGQSELPVARNPMLPQISSHFPLRVRQPFSSWGKICGNQSNSTQRTRPQTVDGNVRSIHPREGGRTFNHLPNLACQQLGKLEMRPALICYALISVKTWK